jgi:hypothetical protein
MELENQRIPLGLWESMQKVCAEHDYRFIKDVSRIIGVEASDIRKRVFGVRGIQTTVAVEHGPWWLESQCPVMNKRTGNMWKRCDDRCGPCGFCWSHRSFRPSATLKLHNDPYFQTLEKRQPFMLDGTIVWVSEKDGSVMKDGVRVAGLTIDTKTGLCKEDLKSA